VRVSVPQGQFNDERRAGMIADVTAAILDAEGGRFERNPWRVLVFPIDVPDGTWDAAGTVWRLRDIAGFGLNDPEKPSSKWLSASCRARTTGWSPSCVHVQRN
jgi:hypothetical protein